MPSEANKEWVSSTCNYGEEFIASIRKGNVQAVQFHPEKSGDAGLSVLRRFLYPSKSYLGKNSTLPKAKALAKRIIACLDVRVNDKGDLVVAKGDQYDVREHSNGNEVRNLGKPVELAGQYYKDGTDEVSFLNITGFGNFLLDDLPMLKVLRYASENVFVPLTFGGGIRDFTDSIGRYYSSLEVAAEYFRSGADKISIGSDAVYEAENYIKTGVNGGREGRPIGAYELAKAVEELGAGEILLNCIDRDGQGKGYDIDLVKLISDAMTIPVISSSGAGDVQHFMDVFRRTSASAAFATGIFHRKEGTLGRRNFWHVDLIVVFLGGYAGPNPCCEEPFV